MSELKAVNGSRIVWEKRGDFVFRGEIQIVKPSMRIDPMKELEKMEEFESIKGGNVICPYCGQPVETLETDMGQVMATHNFQGVDIECIGSFELVILDLGKKGGKGKLVRLPVLDAVRCECLQEVQLIDTDEGYMIEEHKKLGTGYRCHHSGEVIKGTKEQ